MRVPTLGSRRMIESAVTLLPQPDSPTMPSVRPGMSEKLTPPTASVRLPRSPSKTTRRSVDRQERSRAHS